MVILKEFNKQKCKNLVNFPSCNIIFSLDTMYALFVHDTFVYSTGIIFIKNVKNLSKYIKTIICCRLNTIYF